jgi:hypothetical protein
MCAQVKSIFEPESVEQLLRGWLLHAHKGRQRHDLAARRCDLTRRWISGAAAVLSAIVGTSIFAALEKDLGASNLKIKVAIIATGIFSAVLTGLSSFMNLAERTEKHRSASVQYKKMIRELERVLSQPVTEMPREHPDVIRIKQQLDELEEKAPVVPEKFYSQVEHDWKENGIKLVEKAADLYQVGESVPLHS